MRSPHPLRSLRLASVLLALAAALACGGVETGEGRGTIQSVDAQARQITIDHGDIPGIMEAMVMPFEVDDPALLGAAQPGQEVVFEVSYDGRRYVITSLRPAP